MCILYVTPQDETTFGGVTIILVLNSTDTRARCGGNPKALIITVNLFLTKAEWMFNFYPGLPHVTTNAYCQTLSTINLAICTNSTRLFN